MSGGRSPKRKGTRIEYAVVDELVELGVACHRVPLSGAAGGQWSGDIHISLLGRTRRAEVKARANLQLYSWFKSADLLIVKGDRQRPLVVLPIELAVELMLAAEHGSKESDDAHTNP